MRKFLRWGLNIVCSLIFTINSYSQNCVPTNINGATIIYPCNATCQDLRFSVPDLRSDEDYVVSTIPYQFYPATSGTEVSSTYDDDQYSEYIPLTFPFCFYDSTYNNIVIGSNGIVTFEALCANKRNNYDLDPPILIPNGTVAAPTGIADRYIPRTAIMAGYMDIDPSITSGTPLRRIEYNVFGSAPCRKFVVSFYNVVFYGTNCSNDKMTSQIVLHEGTGLIDIFITEKPLCTSWNAGSAILGIQDYSRTKAVVAPGKNCTQWAETNTGYRFTPSGATSRLISSEITDLAGAVLATATTSPGSTGLVDVNFPNFCPSSFGQYILKTTYDACPTGTSIVSTDTINLVQSPQLAFTTSTTDAACGINNGTITVTVPSGSGVPPYSYILDGGTSQTGNVFTNVSGGSHTVTVTDAAGCTNTVTVTVNVIANLAGTITSTGTSCTGVNNGTITVVPTAGTGPYTFVLTPGAVTNNTGIFTGLTPGNYSVTFTDVNSCNGTRTITVAAGTAITASSATTGTSCAGVNNGTITITPTSGSAPYTYTLDGGTPQSSNVFNNVASGAHTVLVRDNVGCTVTVNVNVAAGTVLTGAINTTATSCPGVNDGTITMTNPFGASPGTGPYTYSLNGGPFQTSNVFTGLAAGGPYTVVFRDANGCTGQRSANITSGPSTTTTTATGTNTSCAGSTDGQITIAPITGATYTLNPGAITNTTGIFTGLAAGTYTLSLSTAAGCAPTVTPSTITIQPGGALTATATTTSTCIGGNIGSITVSPLAAPGTIYTLNPGGFSNTTGVFNNLAAGIYTVSFITPANCSGTVSPDPVVGTAAALVTTATTTATNCPGINNGSITVAPVGAGTTYTLNPGTISNTTGIFNGLAAGTYTVSFVTAAGCNGSVTPNPVVNAGAAPTTTATATPTSCPGVADGTVTVTAVGTGTTYTLNPGAITNTTGIFNSLAAGTYTVSFVTAAGCNGTVPVNPEVIAGPSLTSSFAIVNPVCSNINDGIITITPQAGTTAPYTATLTGPGGPYTYTGNAPIEFTNLAPGVYNYTYGEAGGCNGTGASSITLVTNPPIAARASITNLSCNASGNGSVSFNPIGGVAPYQYSLNGGTLQSSNIFNGLNATTYTFTVRDNVGCTKDTTITLTQPTVLTASVTGSTPSGCSNNDGTITALATGGTAPYTYTITSGATTNSTGSSTGVFTGLANGSYTITATDAQACTIAATGIVGITDNMFLTLGPDVTICAEASVTFDPQTNPETNVFTWRGINGTASNTIANTTIKNAVASPLDTAVYELHAQWGTCERWDTIVVNVLRKPIAHAGQDTAICNLTYAILRGSASNVSGPVNYTWSPATDVEFPDQAVTRVTPPGNNTTYQYTLTVTDDYGCNFSVTDQVDVRVQPPVPAYAGNDTTAVQGVPHQLFSSGGQDYLWSPAGPLNSATARNPLATLQADQKFVVRVTDFAGCIGYDTVFVKVYKGPAYYVPNAFTPNGDGLNDVFRPVPAGIARTEYFRIFNRYGETIFETNQYMKGWDGTYKGKLQPVGVYVWIIKGIDRNGKNVEMKGTVTLIQ